MNPISPPTIVGIGELLWDCFEDEKRLGGSPFNFVNICHQLGANAVPVSCIGVDSLGREAKAILADFGVESSCVQEDSEHPTGSVQIQLDLEAKATYTIVEEVAWDHIHFDERLATLSKTVDAVFFGSLCQRSEASRKTIHRFVSMTNPDTLRVYDVNIRPPYFSKDVLLESLQLANVLKLSDDELSEVAQELEVKGSEIEMLNKILEDFDLKIIIYTMGSKGSLTFTRDECVENAVVDVPLMDTVGAGDAFAAAFCVSYLDGRPLDFVGSFASHVSAFVCSRAGASHELPQELVSMLSLSNTSI